MRTDLGQDAYLSVLVSQEYLNSLTKLDRGFKILAPVCWVGGLPLHDLLRHDSGDPFDEGVFCRSFPFSVMVKGPKCLVEIRFVVLSNRSHVVRMIGIPT